MRTSLAFIVLLSLPLAAQAQTVTTSSSSSSVTTQQQEVLPPVVVPQPAPLFLFQVTPPPVIVPAFNTYSAYGYNATNAAFLGYNGFHNNFVGHGFVNRGFVGHNVFVPARGFLTPRVNVVVGNPALRLHNGRLANIGSHGGALPAFHPFRPLLGLRR